MARAVADPSGTFCRCCLSHWCNASTIGRLLAWRIARRASGVSSRTSTLDLVQLAEEFERLLSDRAAVVGPELVELASGVRHAARLSHSKLEAGLVAAKSSVTSWPCQPGFCSTPASRRKARTCCPPRLSAKSNTTAFIGLKLVVQ